MNDWDLLQKLKLYALAKHDDMGVFSTFKIVPMGFPILCPDTSDPFKNRCKLSSFSAHVIVIITFKRIFGASVKNLCDNVFFLFHIRTFRVKISKITTCRSTCRFEPFFSLLKTIHIFRTMAFRTCLGLSGCNITFK